MESAAKPIPQIQARKTATLERRSQTDQVLQRRRNEPFPRSGHPDSERMECRPEGMVSTWSRALLGRSQHPCKTDVRANPWLMPRMESRMQGNLHVRFGEGDEETCPSNGIKRFIPTLRLSEKERVRRRAPDPLSELSEDHLLESSSPLSRTSVMPSSTA